MISTGPRGADNIKVNYSNEGQLYNYLFHATADMFTYIAVNVRYLQADSTLDTNIGSNTVSSNEVGGTKRYNPSTEQQQLR